MQITLNKVPFEVGPVEEKLRVALMSQLELAPMRSRRVAVVDEEGRAKLLVKSADGRNIPLAPGLTVFVPRPDATGGPPRRAGTPTRHMAERLRTAVGAQNLTQVVGGLVQVLGVPRVTVPAFKALEGKGPYIIRMAMDYAVVSLSNASRNLTAYAFVPAAAGFTHAWGMLGEDGAEIAGEAPEGTPPSGALRQVVLLPAGPEAARAIRNIALGQRLRDLQASLGGVSPADLDPTDMRRALASRLGAEVRLLQPSRPAAATSA